MKVNIVHSHTFGPRQELHILRLEFYVRQQNQSTQYSDFKAKIVNVNLRILILKTKNQGHRSISQWWSLFSLKLKWKIRTRIIIMSSFSKCKSTYLLHRKVDIVLLCYWVQLKLIILSSSQHILNTRYLFNEWCPNCTFASCSTQRKFATFRVIQYQDKMGKWYKKTKKLTFLLICDYWNAMQRIFIRFLTWRSKFKWCSFSLNMEKELFWWVNNKNDNVQRRTVSELFILFFEILTKCMSMYIYISLILLFISVAPF